MKIEIGDLVAFNKLEDAVWFEVVNINENHPFRIAVKEANTEYALTGQIRPW